MSEPGFMDTYLPIDSSDERLQSKYTFQKSKKYRLNAVFT